MSKKKQVAFFVNVQVPISHRMGDVKKGVVNKYDLVGKIAQKHHRNSIGGGGYAFTGNDYDISVYMPEPKLKVFLVDLRKHGIRYHKPVVCDWA